MKILRPIVHKDSYTVAVERVVREHLEAVLFAPLVEVMERFKAPDFRRNAVDDWRPMPRFARGLDIPRSALPQISSTDREDLAEFLGTLGVEFTIERTPASALKASQAEFSPSKVDQARERQEELPIIVSRDGYVIDGHHQWLAKLLYRPAERLSIIRFDEDAAALIPHVNIFPGARRENALPGEKSAVVRALEDGRIWYADGEFVGQFNAAISRELRAMGATISPTRATFQLSVDKLPFDVRGAAAASVDRSRALHQALQAELNTIEANAVGYATHLNLKDALSTILTDVAKQFNGTVKALDVVTVDPDLTVEVLAAIEADVTQNLDLPIRNFLEHEIVELRQMIQANTFDGMRADKLAEIIEARWGVTKRKAAFLADQETGLLIAKYREARCREIGSRRYKWSTSHDDLVRHDHRLLDGTIQFWDAKPITNRKTGARNHPGEDFRCRCVAMPIIDELGDTGTLANGREAVFRCTRTA